MIELSNHPADALRLARQRRGQASGDTPEYEEAASRHALLVRRAENARDLARTRRRWLTWARAAFAVGRLRRLAPAPPATSAPPSDEEEILRAGIAGERQVAAEFGGVLGDDWVLLRGYCNPAGEIDHLLLGPAGLIAIESKHLNATVSCDGEDWRFERFDRYGNLAERGRLGDRRGRSPSTQLNEPADRLEQFLRSRGSAVSMLRVVLLTHPNSRTGDCRGASVHVLTSAARLARELDDMPPVLASAQRAAIEELITRDHRYHENRRPRRPPAGGASVRTARRGDARRPGAARTDRSGRSASR
jgi:Nuclease-related domain